MCVDLVVSLIFNVLAKEKPAAAAGRFLLQSPPGLGPSSPEEAALVRGQRWGCGVSKNEVGQCVVRRSLEDAAGPFPADGAVMGRRHLYIGEQAHYFEARPVSIWMDATTQLHKSRHTNKQVCLECIAEV